MSETESTQSHYPAMRPMYQVKWFSKKKGFGFVKDRSGEDIFVHHSDITVDGFRYLKEGEVIHGVEEVMDDGKKKIAKISPAMEGGRLMCQIEAAGRRPRSEPTSDNGDVGESTEPTADTTTTE